MHVCLSCILSNYNIISVYLTLKAQKKADGNIYVCKFSNDVSFKLSHI